MKINYIALGGRRFVFAVALTILASVLLWYGKLTSADFASILNFNIIALVAGHSADKFAERGKNESTGGQSDSRCLGSDCELRSGVAG